MMKQLRTSLDNDTFAGAAAFRGTPVHNYLLW
jgi:hypothetical protein